MLLLFGHVVDTLAQDGAHVVVGQGVEYGFPFAAGGNELAALEQGQLMEMALWLIRRRLAISHTHISLENRQ
jgi:hypothetical protein